MFKFNMEIFATAIIAFLMGIIFDNLVIHALSNDPRFFEFRLYELFQTCCTLAIAAFISYIVSRRINVDVKKREVIIKVIDLFQERVGEVYKNGASYLRAPSKEMEKTILADCKLANGTLSIIKSISEVDSVSYNSVFKSFINFKTALTDHPFGSTAPVFDSDVEDKVSNRYAQHLNSIQKLKISIFSSGT